MSSIGHHANTETLADFAAGRLDEARSVVIATHAAQCARCSEAVAGFETLGGLCLEAADPVEMTQDALKTILARASGVECAPAPATLKGGAAPENRPPLSAYLKGGLDAIKWRPVAPGLSQSVIEAEGYRAGVLRLLKIAPGTKMPRHTHKGSELTLILRGAYTDEIGAFGVGDLADLDKNHTHTPKAVGDEPCICLIATSAPLAFKTLSGRIAQPFIGL